MKFSVKEYLQEKKGADEGLAPIWFDHTDTDESVQPCVKESVEDRLCGIFIPISISVHACLSSRSSSSSLSLRGGAVVQVQQLSDQSLSELRSAVALHGVGVGHLVEDVRVVDGDADAQPEHLLPGLVGLMEDKIPGRLK